MKSRHLHKLPDPKPRNAATRRLELKLQQEKIDRMHTPPKCKLPKLTTKATIIFKYRSLEHADFHPHTVEKIQFDSRTPTFKILQKFVRDHRFTLENYPNDIKVSITIDRPLLIYNEHLSDLIDPYRSAH